MSETPVEPQATPSPAPETSGPVEQMAEAMKVAPLTVRSLLEAGVHFGHQTRRWDPRMKSFIFGERDGIHIIDLDQTLPQFAEALDFLKETVAEGGKVLFVGTKRQAAAPIESEARRSGQFYVSERWLGGMLTNFRTVKKSIDRYKEMLGILEDEEKRAEITKKEAARLTRETNKYRRSLEGIRDMTKLPDAVFIIDVSAEHIAVSEARRLGIPIVAIVDSNCSPVGIDFVVPGNDDAMRAIHLYCALVADGCLAGAALFNERILAEREAESQRRPEAEAAMPSTGRVVVEIKQPPRRGRGEERRARRAREEQDVLDAPAAAPALAAAPAAEPAASEEGTAPAPAPESGTEPVPE
jgi:small subunit ribosomal protein S2